MEITRQDKSREGLTKEKMAQTLFHLFKPENNFAIAKVSRFDVIDIEKLNSLLGTNFRGVILDFDECVAPHHGEILPENAQAIVQMVRSGVKLVISSNMEASARYDGLIKQVHDETGYTINVMTSDHPKPDRRNFEEARDALHLAPGEEAVMIGDNLTTDGGSIRAGIPLILVDPIQTQESTLKRMKRTVQTSMRWAHARLSDIYDLIGHRKVLYDEHFTTR